MMRRGAAIAIAVALLSSACAYQNAIYNARSALEQAERDRRAGQAARAESGYSQVVRRLSDAYRAQEDAEWAGEALLLLGRAHTRLGNLREGRAALVEAEARIPAELRYEWSVALSDVLASMGRRDEALTVADLALRQQALGGRDAQAHLIRGRLYLEVGNREHGLWDLDRAAESREIRTEAALARVAWAVESDERAEAASGAARLLSYVEAGPRFDSLATLVDVAAARWGGDAALAMLGGVPRSTWSRADRGRARMLRARWLRATGDSIEARREVEQVAQGIGPSAEVARIVLVAWSLPSASNLSDLEEPARLLSTSPDDPGATRMLQAIDQIDAYAAVGFDEPLGWFAAAELARDELNAPTLARGLFLAYADGAHDQPWAAKALLAAIELSTSEDDREWLRSRLEAYPDSPYVLAARGNPTTGFQELEEELTLRLGGIRQ